MSMTARVGSLLDNDYRRKNPISVIKEPASSTLIAELRRENKKLEERINKMQLRKDMKPRATSRILVAEGRLGPTPQAPAERELYSKKILTLGQGLNGHGSRTALAGKYSA